MLGSSQAFLAAQTLITHATLHHQRSRAPQPRGEQRPTRRMAWTQPSGGLALALALALTGCGKFREVSACRRVAREINTAIDDIEPLSRAKPVDVRRIAQRYAVLAKALAPNAVGATALSAAVRDYLAVIQGTEAALRAPPPPGQDAATSPEPRHELDRLVRRERTVVSRIEAECQH